MSTNLPSFTIRDLMDVGAHFGHRTMRWNPKMQPYIYGATNNVHIIDLQKTAPLLHSAMGVARDVASKNGKILFVATKRQASQIVAEAAEKCGQYYVNHRWMGGTLTNWSTVSKSIKTLNNLEEKLVNPELTLSKKERLTIQRKIDKLQEALGGIRKMGGKPDLLFVIDTNREKIAIQEARKLGVPVIAIVDTNCDPDNIDFIVPGNDDSIKSIRLFSSLMSDAVLAGISRSISGKGKAIVASGDAAKEKEAAEQEANSKKAQPKPFVKKPSVNKSVEKKEVKQQDGEKQKVANKLKNLKTI
jgi:small subunit ribosomal protein S2